MLHRIAGTAALVGGLLLAGCHSRDHRPAPSDSTKKTEVVHPDNPPDQSPEALSAKHGDKWKDEDEEGGGAGFKAFKEAWVYVDGKPLGVLRQTELPPIPEVWIDQVEYLDFKAGDPGPHERTYQVRRWRLADYLDAVGVDRKKIKAVIIHGGRGVVLIPGDLFRKFANDILFNLTGQTETKLRVSFPYELNTQVNNTYDRYAAVTVIVDKPVPTLDDHDDMVLDGVPLEGIPYYGQPLRGGIRVYLDGRLAMIIKRNSLGDEGRTAPGQDSWNIGALLKARGVDTSHIGAVDVLDPIQVATRLETHDVNTLTFATSTQAQGAVIMGGGEQMTAMMLWTEGKVPPVRQQTPDTRDKK
jgi:hypothetical protein